jgi:hypothetical protein
MYKAIYGVLAASALCLPGCQPQLQQAADILTAPSVTEGTTRTTREGDPIIVDGRSYPVTEVTLESQTADIAGEDRLFNEINVRGRIVRCNRYRPDPDACVRRIRQALEEMESGDEM